MKNLIKKLINKETVSYLIFGVLTTLVNLVVYTFCDNVIFKDAAFATVSGTDAFSKALNTFLEKGVAGIIAWFVAVLFAFVTNRLFVFSERATGFKGIIAECGKFFGARLITGIIEILGVPLFIVIGIDYKLLGKLDIAKVIISVIVIVLNYIFSKLFVFKKSEGKADTCTK